LAVSIVDEADRLNRLVGNLLDLTRLQAGAIPLQRELQPIDEVLVQQLLVNLLDNAAKFAPAGSPIELSVKSVESALVVEVADHGPGIPLGQEERLFEKFVQADKHNRSGSGLGLAICKGVVELHGGRIAAVNRSDADRGAVFRFTLPLASVGR